MIGQKKNYSTCEKRKMIDDMIEKYNLYSPSEPLNVDLQSFYAYVKEKNLSNEDITSEIIKKFSINSKK